MKNISHDSVQNSACLVEQKLNAVFEFLKAHHHWNTELQIFWNRKTLSHCRCALSRLKALLYEIAATQSKVRLDKIAQFWRRLDGYQWSNPYPSLDEFVAFLAGGLSDSDKEKLKEREGIWCKMFYALKCQPGWGDKTAALFVKNVIRIHRWDEERFHFLCDGSQRASEIKKDTLYLPVDSVIIHIFESYFPCACTATFEKINQYLHGRYTPDEMLIWDDLWFWGFITQNSQSPGQGVAAKRKLAWNPGKFWSLQRYSAREMVDIEERAREFIKLLQCFVAQIIGKPLIT